MALSLKRYAWRKDCALFRALAERDKKEKERSLELATLKMGVVLPENVIIEILSWLPVKSLLRLKSVCKSWYAIIASSYFISKHLTNYYYHNNDMDCFFTLKEVTQAGEIEMCLVLADESPSSYASLGDAPLYNSYMCGPCNGIYYRSVFYLDKRALWNPTTNEVKLLPPMITNPDEHNLGVNITYRCYDEAFGFGQDPMTKDYKVVVIKEYTNTEMGEFLSNRSSAVLVYSSRTDSWKYWGDLPERYYLRKNVSYIFVDGCVYWLGCYENSWSDAYLDVMVSFNMANDALEKIQMPNYGKQVSYEDYDKLAYACLGIYRGSIAAYTVSPPHEDGKTFDIWMLNEGIWNKKISISLAGIERPIGHFKNNKAILLSKDYRTLVLFDPDTQEMRDITDARLDGNRYVGVMPYMDSLVSVKGRPGVYEDRIV